MDLIFTLEVHTMSGDVITFKDNEYTRYGFDEHGFYVINDANMVLRVPSERLDYYRRIKEV